MEGLFREPVEPPPAETQAPPGRVVGVAVNSNLWRTFDYLWPDELGAPQVGQRVRVPFGRGNRKTLAFVVETARAAPPGVALKAIDELVDAQTPFDEPLWKLGQWISRYYMTPPGMTLAAMVPSAVGRHATRTETVAYLSAEPDAWPDRLGGRQRRVLDELLEARKQGVEPLTLEQLQHHSGASRDTVRRLTARGLIRTDTRPVRLESLSDQAEGDPFDLNDEQKTVLTELSAKLREGFSVTLLHGVTGSGKTEIYVRAIREVIAAGRQAILLVPEIALATQTLQRLLKRLPRVAVLHSGLTDAQRAFHYEQIRDGHASVVVGPRSAVFAPARRLGLIVVDEEHEPTYKQDTAPRYHGRDVAILRASLSDVPVVLGSATPSLESLHNARAGRYALLRLAHRVRGLPMPALEIVNLRQEIERGRIELIGATLTRRMASTLDAGEQIILLMNRRGYASYVFCPSCHWLMSCESCTRAMVYHQATQVAMCHYCQATAALPDRCPACRGKIVYFGYGIQRIEDELARKFPAARVARMDSDTMTSPAQFEKVFNAFGAGEVDILLGTQMVAKGLDFPRVSLVGVASADTSLAIPDFRASERTFQLIVQVAGRAGRAELPGKVVVQTLHEEEPAIQFALRHDYDGFAAYELPLREEANVPPFSRMVRFLIRHRDLDKVEQGAELLAERLRKLLPNGQAILVGPQPAAVLRIRDQARFQILIVTQRPGVVQQALGEAMGELLTDNPAEVISDVDPVALM